MKTKILSLLLLLAVAGGGFYVWRSGFLTKENPFVIVLSAPETDLSPYHLSLNNLTRTANLYEGLVHFDTNLKIVPGLATTWGNLDPTTWEFKLRRGVSFQDGSALTPEAVISSFQEAQKDTTGEIRTYLRTIQDIKKVDDFTLHIITREPDPLILSRLTKFLITKNGTVGTGPYVVASYAPGKSLLLKANPSYWGRAPVHPLVEYLVTESRNIRAADFESGKTGLLVDVPPDEALTLPKEKLKTSYSLEVNFLMFNGQDEILKDPKIREALSQQLDPQHIETIGSSFVRQANQFIAPGVFGYNPNLPVFVFNDATRPKAIFGQQLKRLSLDFLSSYRTLAEYIQLQFKDAGFLVKLNELSSEELLSKIRANQSQLFLMGWQSENGDAGDFLDAFIDSHGEFNGGRYVNPEIDALILQSRSELDPEKRLKILQDILARLTQENIGVPLFESSRLYAVQNGIAWAPRLDGLVLASEVR